MVRLHRESWEMKTVHASGGSVHKEAAFIVDNVVRGIDDDFSERAARAFIAAIKNLIKTEQYLRALVNLDSKGYRTLI